MAKIHAGSNTATDQEASSFVQEMNRIEEDRENRLHQIDVEFKAKKLAVNQSANAEIKAQLEDAKKVGLAKGTLKLIVNENKALRKAQETLDRRQELANDRLNDLESAEKDRAVSIIKDLGDDFAGFGLGAAAVEREAAKPGNGADPIATAAQKAWEGEDAAGAKH
ncbi:hypothetical protein EOA79_02440 [Mesorhizobium sp. M1A.F.Ca.IN.020.03.2.1]|uniref:hypothetical protein n=1 Tax=Mesorhizobium sp. M1A.F.Ca.IN.020.03.2.1 TaxID=2496769 RepID=UPI000FD5D5FF|nr:hypothetical protein [Mesorhizobium sp. M1A.F.Ca.IN.020.03.2.1]RUV07967.1 hypothetical protein EOA79_02440 [Mesorhizobium sp. M1A.F.Ca.IN.020.03.2.1]